MKEALFQAISAKFWKFVISAKFWKCMTNKTSSDRPTMSHDVNKLVLWPFPRFCFEACPWRRNGGKVDSAEKGEHCFCFRGWVVKGRGIQVTDVVGRAASAWEISRQRWKVKPERRLSRERVYREGEDDREEEDTAQAFAKSTQLHFSSYFLYSHIKKLHCSNLFKNAWITKIDGVLFFLRPKNQGPGLLK